MGKAELGATAAAGRSTAGSAALAYSAQEQALAAQASAHYRSRGVPGDWYVDPADPQAAERYNRSARESLEDQATAFLAAH